MPGYDDRVTRRQRLGTDLSGAIADYSVILAANPRNVSAYYERAQLQEKQGAYQAAIADYSQLIQLQPFQKAWYITRGFAREKMGDKTGASADFKKVAALAQQEGDAADFESWMQRSQAVLK